MPPDHVALDAPALPSLSPPQPGGAARLRANAGGAPRSPPPSHNGGGGGRAPSPTTRYGGGGGRGPFRPSTAHAAASSPSTRRRLAAVLGGALAVVLILLVVKRGGGGQGDKAKPKSGGGNTGRVVAWPPERTPPAGRAAAKLTAALLSLPPPPPPRTSSRPAPAQPHRPAVLYPGIELDADERGDGGKTEAAPRRGGKSVDDDAPPAAPGGNNPQPPPLLVSPAAVARLRSITTGLAPDEPDDDDAEQSWPPAKAYSSLLSAAGAGPLPPPPRKKKNDNPSQTPPPPPVDPLDPDAPSYLDPDGPLMDEMAEQLKAVKRYLASPAFAAAQARRRSTGPERGIVLNAGGPRLLASAAVLLAVLREHLNVTLPVELAWWGGREMDARTLSALERRFAPLRGYDLSTLAYPAHHRPLRPSEAALVVAPGAAAGGGGAVGGGAVGVGGGGAAAAAAAKAAAAATKARRRLSDEAPVLAGTPFDAGDDPDSASNTGSYIRADHHNPTNPSSSLSLKERLQRLRNRKNNNNEPPEQGATRRRFAGKVFSLYASRFQRALVLDADCVPLSGEGLLALFDDPAFLRRGTLFFPDFWAKEESGNRRAAELAGADADASRAALGRGMAGLPGRDTESGQFLVDLNRHADAVEHLWWLNSYPEHTYRAVWGDKDTYAAAFAGAGKAAAFAQSGVPPGGLFAWRPKMLMRTGDGPKDTDRHMDGWMLLGMLQFAPRTGLPLFMHRTIDKFSADRGGGAAVAGGGGGGSGAGGAGAVAGAANGAAQPTTPPTAPLDDSGAAAERDDLLRDPEHLPPHLRRRYADIHPWPIQLATGPLPGRWVRYYLSHDALGPTKGVPWDYVIPSWSVREWLPFPPAASAARVVEAGAQKEKEEEEKKKKQRKRPAVAAAAGGPAFVSDAWQETGEGLPPPPGAEEDNNTNDPFAEEPAAPSRLTCPVATYVAYRRARELGLPVGRNATLDASCRWALRALWGRERWRAFVALGLDERPELLWSAARDPDAAAWSRPAPTLTRTGASLLKPGGGVKAGGRRLTEEAQPEQPQQQPEDDPSAVFSSAGMFSREVPGPLPVAALRWDYAAPRVDSEPLRAVRAAYSAQRALAPGGERYGEFPLLVSRG